MPEMHIGLPPARLVQEFFLGPIQFTNVDTFPIEEVYCDSTANQITIRLSASFPASSPWQGRSMVVFSFYRLPVSADQFTQDVDFFRKEARNKVKLPEGGAFGPLVLGLNHLPKGWEHECFARSGRDLFHVYRSNKTAIMIRWSTQKGTILDHPLFTRIAENVQLKPAKWTRALPEYQLQPEENATPPEADEETHMDLTLDLRDESSAISSFLKQRIDKFDAAKNYGPGDGSKVTFVELGFDFEQGGWVSLVFDMRPDANPDGSWTTFLEDPNLFPRPRWPLLCDALCEGDDIVVTMLDGSEQTVSADSAECVKVLGEMLKDVVSNARSTGVFKSLPTSPDCFIGIEDINGSYGWPAYKNRKTEGRLSQEPGKPKRKTTRRK